MKISYNWLKNYIKTDLPPVKVAELLTDCGLEVESFEEYESIKGGLHGVVIGKVLTCQKHPNADKLSVTTVDVGMEMPLPIVCGAPNVAAGQKVLVATVGTTIYKGQDSFTIGKAKIRGEVSEGMICAEDELGLGESHAGIMVLPDDVTVGTPAASYFQVYEDVIFEIGLTPNRADATSHYGVARDLSAVLSNLKDSPEKITATLPSTDGFTIDNHDLDIPVVVENEKACLRYAGITISNITVKESPDWLKNYLKAIGLRPINNIVDITNFILFELGQPLHAFDAGKIRGGKVIVKTLPAGTRFVTLDEVERSLGPDDLMICDTEGGMCMGGVYGGLNSGVTAETKSIFLESACFHPVFIRKTSRLHGLKTDASFRFERGVDPNITIYALKRAAMLIRELAGGVISSDIKDIYPNPIPNFNVKVRYDHVDRLIGKKIDHQVVKNIIGSLGIEILEESESEMQVSVPPFKVDVNREADVVEEILRIYGYNNIEIENEVRFSFVNSPKPDLEKLRGVAAGLLTGMGFHEIMCNSLTRSSYKGLSESFPPEIFVPILNPLSKDLEVMRPNLLFGGLETILFNRNRKNSDLKLFEFGNTYQIQSNKTGDDLGSYFEEEHLAFFVSGNQTTETWRVPSKPMDYYDLKVPFFNVVQRLGISPAFLSQKETDLKIFLVGFDYFVQNERIASLGEVHPNILKAFDIRDKVYYGFIRWNKLTALTLTSNIQFSDLPKFPEVRRDLALLVDRTTDFLEIEKAAYECEKNILRSVNLFDVYEGTGVPDGKKSYAVSFVLRDDERTLRDEDIEKIMDKLVKVFSERLGATLR